MSIVPIDDQDLTFIDSVLAHYGNHHSISNCSELDGFLTGLLSSPVKLDLSEWMCAIWGGAEHLPKWENPDETKLFTGLLFVIISQTAAMLKHDADQFEPMFVHSGEHENAAIWVHQWCAGYLRAVALRPEPWQGLPEDTAKNLRWIEAAASYQPEPGEPRTQPGAPSPKRIEMAVLALYAHWRRQGQLQPAPRPAEGRQNLNATPPNTKVSRNAPCPCGSGKKYKKCCGG